MSDWPQHPGMVKERNRFRRMGAKRRQGYLNHYANTMHTRLNDAKVGQYGRLSAIHEALLAREGGEEKE